MLTAFANGGIICIQNNRCCLREKEIEINPMGKLLNSFCILILIHTRDVFYVRREVDIMKTAKVNAYIMHIFGKIELLSIYAT